MERGLTARKEELCTDLQKRHQVLNGMQTLEKKLRADVSVNQDIRCLTSLYTQWKEWSSNS